MKNFKSTTLFATSLVASSFISQAAMAGEEGTLDEYSGHPHDTDVTSESAMPMHSLQAKRENYSLEDKTEAEKLDAELFPDISR